MVALKRKIEELEVLHKNHINRPTFDDEERTYQQQQIELLASVSCSFALASSVFCLDVSLGS